MSLKIFFHIFQQMQYIAIPLLVVALGGLFSERSGVINIALEGTMVFGQFFGIMTMFLLQDTMSGQMLFILSMLVATLSGIILSSIHAYASINMKADQTISGTAINMFAPAFTIFVARLFYSVKEVPFTNTFLIHKIPLLGDIPYIGPMFFQRVYISTFIGIAILAISIFVIYKTKFGYHLRAAGENPQALDAAGVNVYKIRWISVLLSGALSGLGGLIIMVPMSTVFAGTANGAGFLALAILIFSQWKPVNLIFTSFFFAITLTISNTYSVIPALVQIGIPGQVFRMFPYIATLVVLIFTSKKSAAPKDLGEPYDQGQR